MNDLLLTAILIVFAYMSVAAFGVIAGALWDMARSILQGGRDE